jgi:NIPSNAP
VFIPSRRSLGEGGSDGGGKTWEIHRMMDVTKARESTCCPVVELRQYTLRKGSRDTLIDLFEKEFIESQETLGMRVIGTFRDLEKPDRFVWLRGFQNMNARAIQLQQFYGGPVWKAHREAANATMIDSDNVLLLRPANRSGFTLPRTRLAYRAVPTNPPGMVVATIYHLEKGTEAKFAEFFRATIVPILARVPIPILGEWITEHHRNTFPGLPVREDANVFVWFSSFSDRAAYEAQAAFLEDEILSKCASRIQGQPEMLLLAPTVRSLLRSVDLLARTHA